MVWNWLNPCGWGLSSLIVDLSLIGLTMGDWWPIVGR